MPRKLISGLIVLAALALLAAPASALPPQCYEVCLAPVDCDTLCASGFRVTTCCGFFAYFSSLGNEDSSCLSQGPELNLDILPDESDTGTAVEAGAQIEPPTGATDANRGLVQPEVP